MFFILTKSRINPVGTTALLSINGNTGHIEGNYIPEDSQQEIDFDAKDAVSQKTGASHYAFTGF